MEATRQLAARMNYYGREIGFYRDCADDCGVKVPRCYSAESVQEDNRFAMIIEDLAPASPVDQVEGCSFEESAKVMRAFADLHAHWWNSPKLKSIGWPSPITHVQPASESLALLEASIIDAEKQVGSTLTQHETAIATATALMQDGAASTLSVHAGSRRPSLG